FMIGMEESVFPHMRSLTEPRELEEERRLCYVGITRAREKLYLTHAWQRNLYGGTQYNAPSRFLTEIPADLMDMPAASRENRPKSSFGGGRRRDWSSTSWTSDDSSSSVASPPPKRQPNRVEDGRFKIGDDVIHNVWGDGVVLAVSGTGDKTEAVVNFASVGEKRLLLAWAPLEKPGESV
ncbi:MAG: ATP-dependent DNA helicase PcrA, partial [Microthrixaceae bacterium]|nr:ATP-dependent DNA helicase PcrA [Microthrixaceae bacterium]